MWPKKLPLCDNQSQNISTTVLKYGDADLSSKRRKLEEQIEAVEVNSSCSDADAAADELNYEEFVSETCLNSSFKSLEVDQHNQDFKGGLLTSSTSNIKIPTDDNATSANSSFLVTKKPSLTSKGLENSFKILQNQVEYNKQKSLSTIKSPNISTTTTTEEKETVSRFELELEAANRFQLKTEHDKTELLTFLKDFGSQVINQNNFNTNTDGEDKSEANGASFMYFAAKSSDGRNCLKKVRSLGENIVLCGNRVSQMTRTYDDIEAVTRLLEEKEKDLELTVQIGKELLTQNNRLESRVNDMESELKESNEDRAQLVHELHKKNELINVLTSDSDNISEADSPTFSKSVTFDLLQKKITALQDENKSLKVEASQLASQTDEVEAHEKKLMEELSTQMNDANSQFENLSLELERQREENRLQHEQIVNLTARLAEAEMRLHQLTHDNDEHITLLNITKENQNSLAMELVEFKQRYQEVLALLQEAQEQLRKQRKRTQPQVRSNFLTSGMGMSMIATDSLQSELMESSLYSENSLDSGIAGDTTHRMAHERMLGRMGMTQTPGSGSMYSSMAGGSGNSTGTIIGNEAMGAVPPYKRVFETVRAASKNGLYADGGASISQIGSMSMSSASVPRMSALPYAAAPAGSYYRNSGSYDGQSMGLRVLSSESLASQSDDGYPAQPSGVPGAPGAKDLEAALKRLTPAEVLARRAMLSYAPAGTYSYDEQTNNSLPLGIRTPDSIMSTGSSGISSSTNMSSSLTQWRLPEKLQIVKPMEGSQTLHHWSRLATPTLSGLLDERPGVTIRGGRGLDDLGMQVYTLSDVEEDITDDCTPGKQFDAPGCTYTYTTSHVMHPDYGLVNDLSFLSRSQMSSRMASASTSRQPSCPATPHAGLSRKNSCSTFSVNMGLASMLNERGIKAVTPSAINTPAGPNFSPTVTPCNSPAHSPDGSPTRSRSPEPLFGLLSTGADLIRRKLVGDFDNRSHRAQNHHQKIMLSRLERRALRSLKLVEKVESIGLENIIAAQPSSMSQLASGIANRSSSPLTQLTSLKNIHTNANNIVDDIQFDRNHIKDVLQKGLNNTSNKTKLATDAAHGLKSSETAKQPEPENAKPPTAALNVETPSTSSSYTDVRVKQMQRQKSRRNLKNGMAAQRPDLGTINGAGGGRVRSDLGKVKREEDALSNSSSSKLQRDDKAPEQAQSITQSFVGSVSSLLFGRKGGWL